MVVGAGVGGAMAKAWSADEPLATALGGFATGVDDHLDRVQRVRGVVPLPSSPRPLYPQA